MIGSLPDVVLGFGASNLALSGAIAVLAWSAQRILRCPTLAHVLWILVLAKLVTPPLVGLPVLPNGAELENEIAAAAATPATFVTDPAAAASTPPATDAVGATIDWSLIDWSTALWWLAAAWLVGSTFVLVATGLRIRRFDRLLRQSARPAAPAVQQRARRLASRLGLTNTPTIFLTPANVSPMVWWIGGAVRIYLPTGLPARISGGDLHWVLAHELAHVRRRDHCVRWLEWLACVAFWWNPIAWWARRNLRQNEEVCCDALVLRTFCPLPKTYANSLLTVVEFLATPAVRPPAMASEIDSGGFLERRFRMIVGKTPILSTPRWLQIATLLLTACVLPLGLASAQEPDVTAVGARIKQAVKAGELTPAQARAMMQALKTRTGAQAKKKAAKNKKAQKAAKADPARKVRRVRTEQPEEIEEIEVSGVEVEVEVESPRVSIEIEVSEPMLEEIEIVEEPVEVEEIETVQEPVRIRQRIRPVERDTALRRERLQRQRDVRREELRRRAAEQRDRARVERDARRTEMKRRAAERKTRATGRGKPAKERVRWNSAIGIGGGEGGAVRQREQAEREKRAAERALRSKAREQWNAAVGADGKLRERISSHELELADLKRQLEKRLGDATGDATKTRRLAEETVARRQRELARKFEAIARRNTGDDAAARLRTIEQRLGDRTAAIARRQAALAERAAELAEMHAARNALTKAVKAGKIDKGAAKAKLEAAQQQLEAAEAQLRAQKLELSDKAKQAAELRLREGNLPRRGLDAGQRQTGLEVIRAKELEAAKINAERKARAEERAKMRGKRRPQKSVVR